MYNPFSMPAERAAPYTIHIVGAPRSTLRDLYHAFLRWPWPASIGLIIGAYVVINTLFALAYVATGGLGHGPGMAGDDYLSAFFFSVQTMGTIGYGVLYPLSTAANVVVVTESMTSLVFTAVATGAVFAKFSRARARIVYANHAVITPLNGVPTLMIRVGNERGNLIVDVQVRMAVSLTETTLEGSTLYRNLDLRPTRERLLSLSRSWTIVHPITEDSPLFGLGPDGFRAREGEIFVHVMGIDDATMQPVFAQTRYFPDDILHDSRYADILSERPDGDLVLDLSKFHVTERVK